MQWTGSLDGNYCNQLNHGSGTVFQVSTQFNSLVVKNLTFVICRGSLNGEVVTLEQPIPSRDRMVPAVEQVYSYQKYNDQENI